MTDLRKAAEMALEFVDWLCGDDHSVKPKNKALDVREALRQALAQPEQEPVAWVECAVIPWLQSKDTNSYAMTKLHRVPSEYYDTPLYTAPPKREWVGLTDEEIDGLWKMAQMFRAHKHFYLLVEAKLKEKNT